MTTHDADDVERMIVEARELRAHLRRRGVPVHLAVAAMLEVIATLSIAEGDDARSRAVMDEVVVRLREFHEGILKGKQR